LEEQFSHTRKFTRTPELVVTIITTKLKAYNNKAERKSHKFNVHSLKEKEKREEFKLELRNNFSAHAELSEETVEEQWSNLCNTWKTTCETVLGKKRMQHKERLTSTAWTLITERKQLKDQINQTQDQEDTK
jgi:hypothetical protein